jgi:hypothetical protein
MDATITYNEVVNLIGVNVRTTNNEHPNFESIQLLHPHFERALQCLPCPQSALHGWKRLVMARELYSLLAPMPFCTPNDPGPSAIYIRALNPANSVPDPALLTRTEQAMINTMFVHCKHYLLSMRNIGKACFTILDSTINDAFKVSNDPAIQG